MVEKAGDAEAKANLQPPFYVREIDSKCLKGHHLSAKKDKKDTYRESRNEASKDKDKAKSHNSSSANQPQTQALKNDKHGCRGGHPAIGINATKVAKKDKDKVPKDLSYVKCYTYKQNGHYINKYPEKTKN